MDSHANIVKLAFMMSYLATLICVVSGIPFLTAVFRALILMTVFCAIGFAFRWYLMRLVGSVEPEPRQREYEDFGEEEEQEQPEYEVPKLIPDEQQTEQQQQERVAEIAQHLSGGPGEEILENVERSQQ